MIKIALLRRKVAIVVVAAINILLSNVASLAAISTTLIIDQPHHIMRYQCVGGTTSAGSPSYVQVPCSGSVGGNELCPANTSNVGIYSAPIYSQVCQTCCTLGYSYPCIPDFWNTCTMCLAHAPCNCTNIQTGTICYMECQGFQMPSSNCGWH